MKLAEPEGEELPLRGFTSGNEGYIAPSGTKTAINVNPASQRLQLLTPFPAWDGQDILNMPLLIKRRGKCIYRPYFDGGTVAAFSRTFGEYFG